MQAIAPMIVSASRATDIPAFYADWFFNRLESGYCVWRNPFSGQESYVSFEDTRFIVFWSKNPEALLGNLDILDTKGIACYLQYTLNDYEADSLEPGVPSLVKRVATFKELSRRLGKESVVWRYDPLILTDSIGIKELLEKISRLADDLKDYTEKLVFSFADIGSYVKVKRNLDQYGVRYREWTAPEMIEFASRLAQLNSEKGWNLRLATCGEKIGLEEFGIEHNRCVDDELIARIAWRDPLLMAHLGMEVRTLSPSLFGDEELPSDAIILDATHYAIRTRSNRATGQRKFCGCIESKDIGQYNTCAHGCLYCYANSSPAHALVNHRRHLAANASDTIL